MLQRMIRALLGGRPMTFERHAFTDGVTGEAVGYWKDTAGRRWMATSRWGWFRVEAGR